MTRSGLPRDLGVHTSWVTFNRPRTPEEAEVLVDLLSTESRMSDDELEALAARIAPNKRTEAVEMIAELQSNPMISEPVLEYYSRRLLSLAA
jgi:hypothetical protein